MDKEWMSKNRLSQEYDVGVESFLKFALKNADHPDAISCPCARCGNLKKKNVEIIRAHLYCNGVDLTYRTWIWHGERSTKGNSMNGNARVGQDENKSCDEEPIYMLMSDEQKERRKQNVYPHCHSRKGYVRSAEEIANALCDDDDINRALSWKKGRVNKEGAFDGDELNVAVDKIDDYIQKKREGTLQITGPKDDILTKVLDSGERGGCVRAIEGHITPTLYFNVGRIWRNVGVDKDIMIEQKKELVKAKKLISEQDERIKKLEALVYKKGGCVNEIDDIDSCSVKLHRLNENQLKVEKSFHSDEDLDDVDIQIVEKSTALQGKSVVLTLESGTDVAYGTVVEVNGASKLLHGVPLPQNCTRVSIDKALQKSARLPVPIPNECENVGDAVETHVAWPKHLIVLRENRFMKKTAREESKKDLASNVPRSVRLLYCYCKRALNNGRNLSFLLDHGVFEDDYELNLYLEDISPLYHLEAITGNCVVVYIWYLYQKMVKENKIDKFRFVNPHNIAN